MEHKRRLLEQLGGIESGLCERVLKNPRWVPRTYSEPIRQKAPYISPRDAALRRLEAGMLVNEYRRLLNQLKTAELSGSTEKSSELDFDAELNSVTQSQAPASTLTDQYKLFKNSVGRKRLYCEFTSDRILETVDKYPAEENFGENLYLEPFYLKLLSTQTKKPESYIEYLQGIGKYLTPELCTYLRSFHARALEVGTSNSDSVPNKLLEPNNAQLGEPFYCAVCERSFSKQSVFEAHFNGKKHKSRVTKPADSSVSMQTILLNLEPVITKTVANIRRKAGMTVHERELEIEAIEKERELEEGFVSDNSEHEESDADFEQPLTGPEGTPIPRWLYRLKGLRNWYPCEICGSHIKFQGRRAFDRHFDDPKDQRHALGLARLGITDVYKYKGIATIEEAKQLYKTLRRNEIRARTDAEVEDSEGNVMTERMYEDLKKQGLL